MGLEARSIGAAAIILVSSGDSLADYIRVRACRSSVARVVDEMEAPCGGGITLAREPASQPERRRRAQRAPLEVYVLTGASCGRRYRCGICSSGLRRFLGFTHEVDTHELETLVRIGMYA
eukprot:GHVU01055426.1.p1 GENE.GHVU01055426.1~~GHVU01055426.1.p1  ORF type:complete len:120 (+),score=7.84 GHVU01055426.1:345-704(+)